MLLSGRENYIEGWGMGRGRGKGGKGRGLEGGWGVKPSLFSSIFIIMDEYFQEEFRV